MTFNVFVPRLLEMVSRGLLIWNICAFLIIVITILAMNDHKQPASFVFSDFVNFTGFNPAYTAVVGLLQTAFGMCCYDAPVGNVSRPWMKYKPISSHLLTHVVGFAGTYDGGDQTRKKTGSTCYHPLRVPRCCYWLRLPDSGLLLYRRYRVNSLDSDTCSNYSNLPQ